MGFRGYREEADTAAPTLREGYLAGMFATLPPLARRNLIHDYPWDSRQMVSLPEIFSAWIALDGETFSLSAGTINDYEETLDMRSGVLERCVLWTSPGKKTTKICFTRFLCAGRPNLAVQKIDIEPVNWSGIAEIIWEYDIGQPSLFRCGDPAKPHLPCPLCAVMETGVVKDRVHGVVETHGSGHRIAYASRVYDETAAGDSLASGLLSQSAADSVAAETSRSWTRITAVTTSRDTDPADPLRRAQALLDEAEYEALAEEQEHIWQGRWQDADIGLDGPVHDQVLIRFGLFSLLQMAPYHADNLSVPARGYAYNRYNGLYFWDGEIFLVPFYQFCAPEVARNLLNFRCRTLPGARRNAELLGGKGAIFPWQGDAEYGEEQAPWGLYQYLWHQSADIVYAFDQYARATGDEALMFGPGLEVLAETARFWITRLKQDERGLYHLYGAVGPDEAEEHGPDNGYTNLMVQRSLEISCHWWILAHVRAPEQAAAMADRLGLPKQEISAWAEAAAHLCIPEVPNRPGVPLQDAFLLKRKPVDLSGMTVPEFWERRGEVQVIKQADIILAMYLLEDRFTREQIEAGYDFYEPRTLHVSSLSLNTHSIVAAIIGRTGAAYDYFRRAAGLDLDNFREASRDGLHSAALGAVWQMVIPGFTGLRVREDHIAFQPALPADWKALRFPLHYRGWRLECTVSRTSFRIEVSGSGHENSTVKISRRPHILEDRLVIEAPLESGTNPKEENPCSPSRQYSLT
jgi:trehalose/maltose hydrolase-like predicted phosphorylase